MKQTTFSTCVLSVITATVMVLAAGPVQAEFLGKFGEWEAHVSADGNAKVCYAATVPTKSEGNYTRRGDVFLLVSHRLADNQTGYVSMEAGYPYAPQGKINAKIGSRDHAMFPSGELAFAFEDKPLVQAMVRGANMVVTGTSSRGTLTTDTFSLTGFTAAYRAASEACGVTP